MPYLNGRVMDISTVTMPGSNLVKRISLEFNSECIAWHYGWTSHKFSSNKEHVIDVMVLVERDMSENRLFVAASYLSPSFRITSTKKSKKDMKEQLLQQQIEDVVDRRREEWVTVIGKVREEARAEERDQNEGEGEGKNDGDGEGRDFVSSMGWCVPHEHARAMLPAVSTPLSARGGPLITTPPDVPCRAQSPSAYSVCTDATSTCTTEEDCSLPGPDGYEYSRYSYAPGGATTSFMSPLTRQASGSFAEGAMGFLAGERGMQSTKEQVGEGRDREAPTTPRIYSKRAYYEL